MVYHVATLNPSEGQMADLAEGTEVKLSNEHFHGSVPFHLTTGQMKKIMKAADAGRGCTLKFSAAQLKHHVQNGSGRFTDILRTGYNMAKPLLKAGLSKGLDIGRDFAEKKLAHAAGLNGDGFFSDAGRWLGHTVVDGAVDLLGGDIVPKRKPKQVGKGWIGNLAKKVGHAVVDGGVNLLGGEIAPNLLANPNEGIRAALFKKKVQGAGLYQ